MLNVVLPLMGLAFLTGTPTAINGPTHRINPAKAQINIFDAWKASVIILELDDYGSSAFLVDKDGIVVTAATKTLGKSLQLAIRMPDNRRFTATVIQNDIQTGIALLKVNPDVVKDLTPIPLPSDTATTLTIGDTVTGIENHPLKGLKGVFGVVTTVENGIASLDIKRDGFIGGSPLFGDSGRLIGMASDVMKLKEPGSSPLPIVTSKDIAAALITAKAQVLANPSPVALPSISNIMIPRASLQKAYDSAAEIQKQQVKIPGMNFAIFTPFSFQRAAHKLDNDLMKKYKGMSLDEIRSKHPEVGSASDILETTIGRDDLPVVIFECTLPLFERSVRLDRIGRQRTFDNAFEYRNSFLDMKVMHGDVELIPVRSHRFEHSDFSRKGAASGDEFNTLSAMVMYDPRGFDPSQKITIRVLTASKPNEWLIFELDKQMQQQFWDDFADWRALNPK